MKINHRTFTDGNGPCWARNDYRNSHNSPFGFSDTEDILWDSICRGKMWVQLGLVLSLMLCPVGTVDPVEKNSIELQHVKKEVTPLLIVIFVL